MQLRLTSWLVHGGEQKKAGTIRPGLIAHLLHAQQWAQQVNRWNWVWELVVSWETVLDNAGHWMELAQMWSCAVEAKHHETPKRNLGIALHNYGVTLHKMGRLLEAQSCYEKSGTIFLAEGMPGDLGRSILERGILADELGKYTEAEARYDECLEIFRKGDDDIGIANTLYQQGKLARMQGKLAKSTKLLENSLARFQKAGRTSDVSRCLQVLGIIKMISDLGGAEDLLRNSLAHAQEAGDVSARSKSLHGLGIMKYQAGQFDQAKHYFCESLALKRQIGDRLGAASTLYMLGMLAEEHGEYEEAYESYQESLGKMDAASVQSADRGKALFGLARVAYVFDDSTKARELATEALNCLLQLRDPVCEKVQDFLAALG